MASVTHASTRRGSAQEIWAWCLYDWAQSAYSTLQITVVVIYLTRILLPGDAGARLYAFGIGGTTLCAAVLSPLIGALADAHATKRRWLAITTLPSVLAALGMAFVPESQWLLVAVLFIVMNLGYEVSQGLYNAFLTEIAEGDDVDRVSARGFALGYIGGGLVLILALLVLMRGHWFGMLADTRYDLHAAPAAMFRVDLPPGNYQVTLTAGDPSVARDRMRYEVNGVTGALVDAARGEFATQSVTVAAPDGRLRVVMRDEGGNDPLAVLNDLKIEPATGAGLGVNFDFGSSNSPNDAGCIFVLPGDGFESRPLFGKDQRYKVAGKQPPTETPRQLAFGWETGTVTAVDRIVAPRLRVGIAILGVWWGLFSLPALLILKDRGPPKARDQGLAGAATTAVRQVVSTLGRVRRYRMLFLFLLAYLIYNDGIQTIISQASLFADRALGIKEAELTLVVLMIQFLALPGALFVGWLSTRWGQKPTLLACLAIYMVWLGAAFFITTFAQFVAMGAVLALVMGGSQSVSRAVMAKMTPPQHAGQFFGFFSFSGKATSALGPFIFGTVLTTAGSPYLAILSLLVFFVVGTLFLLPVDIERGRRDAQAVG